MCNKTYVNDLIDQFVKRGSIIYRSLIDLKDQDSVWKVK